MAWEVTASPVRFDEAIDWFRAKAGNAVTREQWDALDARAKRRAFTVSGLTKLDVIQRVWEQLDKAIEQGLSFQDFRKSAVQDLADTWLSEDSARLETIYRNNVQSAFAAGRYLQATSPDALEQHPVWMLDVVMDSRTSDVCEPLDGVKRRANDPWWQGRIPPLHHKCRTGLLTLTEEDAHEMGGLTEPAPSDKAQGDWGARPELDEWKGDPTSYAPELQSEARRVVEEARNVGSPLANPAMPKTPAMADSTPRDPGAAGGSNSGGGGLPPAPPPAPPGDGGNGSSKPKKGPSRDVKKPNQRHDLNRIRPKHRAAEKNTVILPSVPVDNDVEAIRNGDASVEGNGWRVNGRLYIPEPNGTLIPVDGPGLVRLSRSQFKALRALVEHDGDVQKAKCVLEHLSLSDAEMDLVWYLFRLRRQPGAG